MFGELELTTSAIVLQKLAAWVRMPSKQRVSMKAAAAAILSLFKCLSFAKPLRTHLSEFKTCFG